MNFPVSSLVEISENKLVAADELCVENVLLKETPVAAILFDDALDKERNEPFLDIMTSLSLRSPPPLKCTLLSKKGCVKLALAARWTQDAGFTQPL